MSAMASGDKPRLTETERDMVEFYTKELAQLVTTTPSARPSPALVERQVRDQPQL